MKNVTLAIPDDVYRLARIKAAEQGRSVSAMVADYLRSLATEESEFDRLEALQRSVLAQIKGLSASDRLSRDEVHSRALR